MIPNLRLSSQKASIYSDVDGLSLQNLFYVYNEYFPNCYMFARNDRASDNYFDTEKLIKYLEDNATEEDEMSTIRYITEDIESKECRTGICVLLKKDNIFARIENSVSESYILFANDGVEALDRFKEILYQFYVSPEDEKNNLWKISQSSSGFYKSKGTIKEVKDFDISLQYNDDFAHEDERIQRFIDNEDKSGLVILHGEKGTGKTTYIRNLITSNPSKKFVFVSPDLVSALGSPSFTSFLETLNKHIIILEDCETVIRDRKAIGANSEVSTLLNMSDGLLADDLGIKFICTYNEDIKDIDSALLRKGRLVSKYEFKPLTVEKTNKLFEHIFDNMTDEEKEEYSATEAPTSNKGLTLADIYNYYEDSYEQKKKPII